MICGVICPGFLIPQLLSAGQRLCLWLPMTPPAWKGACCIQGLYLTSQRQKRRSLPSPVYVRPREETYYLVWVMPPPLDQASMARGRVL